MYRTLTYRKTDHHGVVGEPGQKGGLWRSKLGLNISLNPEILKVMFLDAAQGKIITRQCKTEKNMCMDLLELMKQSILFKNQAPGSPDPNPDFSMLLTINSLNYITA